jgi:hypothetical protein
MASVYLRIDQPGSITDLPPVCLKCGAPATVFKNKQFSWQPPWVIILLPLGLIPYAIVSSILSRNKTVETPFCPRHKSYWWLFPTLVTVACLGVLILGFVVTMAVAIIHTTSQNHGADFGASCGITVLMFFGILLAAAVLSMTRRIRATEITERYVRLTGVSPEFADAVEQEEETRRRAFDRDIDDRRPREERDRYRERPDEPRYQN